MKPESPGSQASQSLLAELLLSLDPTDTNDAESDETLSRIRELLASGALEGALDDSFVLLVEDVSLPGLPLPGEPPWLCESHWTPLTWAARQGLAQVARLLLEAGADLNQKNVDEEFVGTPLTWAAERGHLEVVDLLLAAGVDPGPVKALGTSPLHVAAFRSHLAIVERLLAAGADPTAIDAQKQTVAQVARGRHEAKIRAALRAVSPPHDDSGCAVRISRHRRKIDPAQTVGARDFLKIWGGANDWHMFGVEADLEAVADACAELFKARRRYPDIAHRSVPDLEELLLLLRLRSTSWTLGSYETVYADRREVETVAENSVELSKRFDTRAFCFQYNDTAGAMAYALYTSGECVESAGSYEYRVKHRTGDVDRPLDVDPGRDSDLFFSHHGILIPPFGTLVEGPKTFLELACLKRTDLERADLFDMSRD